MDRSPGSVEYARGRAARASIGTVPRSVTGGWRSSVIRYPVALALVVTLVVAGCGSETPQPSGSALAVIQPSASGSSSASSTPLVTATPRVTPIATPTALPTASPSRTPTPVPTPVPWKTYTSKRYHYKMQYPPDWIVTPGSSGISDQFDGFADPYVYVSRDVVAAGGIASLSLTTRHQIAYYKSHYKAKLIVNKSVKVAGWSGRLLIFSGVDNGVKKQFQTLNLSKGRVGYFIDMDGLIQAAKADKALFKKIYLTFRPR
jgi:hypothetical protein